MKKDKINLKSFLKALLIILIVALLIKAFFFDAFEIPTSSMENTLLPGDFIIAGKAAYKISTPKEIPVLNIRIPYIDLIETGEPRVNDLIVFDFPGNKILGSAKYVKRIIAGPGDSLRIVRNDLFINSIKIELPSTLKFTGSSDGLMDKKDEKIFPPDSKWSRNNYGPIVIPQKGDIIKIDAGNFEKWKDLISLDSPDNVVREEGSVVTLNGWPIKEYTLTKNYYFVIGDNFDQSMDSRYFGFITDDMIVGKALFIYWSIDGNKMAPGPLGFLSALRTKRLLQGVE
ncbi:MAG TPA: signal peptidase I [Ignavibacteriaceae bacterium]|nr:signal peptidase I [Ignavibacteriaceae bacterium]